MDIKSVILIKKSRRDDDRTSLITREASGAKWSESVVTVGDIGRRLPSVCPVPICPSVSPKLSIDHDATDFHNFFRRSFIKNKKNKDFFLISNFVSQK